MIKVEHTRIYKPTIVGYDENSILLDKKGNIVENRLVTDAELVLVECKNETYPFYGVHLGSGKLALPIIVSRTEKIEVGDWFYSEKYETIDKIASNGVINKKKCFKILALPEHFSSEQLQMIVDGELKEGQKILLEVEPT